VVFSSIEDLLGKPEVLAVFQETVDAINSELARYEQVREFRLLPDSLTIEGGFLTPTLKVKRRIVDDRFADIIDDIYSS
jgi:long-chain acyl-CoA synthetase